jgi:hypothetical protein
MNHATLDSVLLNPLISGRLRDVKIGGRLFDRSIPSYECDRSSSELSGIG